MNKINKYRVYVQSSLYTVWKDNGELDWDKMKLDGCYSFTTEAYSEHSVLLSCREAHPHCVYLITQIN